MDRHDLNARKVVMTAEDIKNIRDFFTHFKIEIPKPLQSILEVFEKDISKVTFDDQIKLRAFIAHTIVDSKHPLLTDKVFENIRKNCDAAWYDAQFDLDLEEVLTEEKKEG
jgi:hypothetical protein